VSALWVSLAALPVPVAVIGGQTSVGYLLVLWFRYAGGDHETRSIHRVPTLDRASVAVLVLLVCLASMAGHLAKPLAVSALVPCGVVLVRRTCAFLADREHVGVVARQVAPEPHIALPFAWREHVKRQIPGPLGLLLRLTIVVLPKECRSRYAEEFLAELLEVRRLRRIRHCVGLCSRAWGLRRTLQGKAITAADEAFDQAFDEE
jgi:hypothetical protein